MTSSKREAPGAKTFFRALSFFAVVALRASVLALPPEEEVKTVIKGARMDVLKKGEMTEFTGGVTLTRGNDFMSADRMVNHEKDGVTQAWGRVYLRRKDPIRGALWETWSDRAVYDSNASSGTLWGNVYMEVRESTPSARTTRVWADRAERNPAQGSLRFTGVYAAKAAGSRAMPAWPKGAKARPRVVQQEGPESRDLAGETVTYFEEGGRVVAEGNVRTAWDKGEANGAQR